MNAHIYAIKDSLNGFISLTLDDNDESATRSFAWAVLNTDSIIGFSPNDFDLYHMGIFDRDSGFITMDKMPTLVVRGANIATVYRQQEIDDDE